MSEFQYYEFQSIDRNLSKKEMEEIDAMSSRVSLTPRRAVFTYSYSDFRYDVESVLLNYFDAFLYMANWGTKRLMFKFPEELVDFDFIKQYNATFDDAFENCLKIYKKQNFVLIEINISYEDESWWLDEDQSWLYEIIEIRRGILNKDYRSLFLIWLHFLNLKYDCEELGPKEKIKLDLIPDNLNNISGGLRALLEFYDINVDWINAASKHSSTILEEDVDYTKVVKSLPQKVKDEFLLKMLSGENNLVLKLKNVIDDLGKKKGKKKLSKGEITIEELLSDVKSAEKKRESKEEEEREEAYLKKMKSLAKNERTTLKEIESLISHGSGKSYDNVLSNLLDLRELAIYRKKLGDFEKYVEKLKNTYSRKPALIRRLETLNQ